MKTAKSVVGLFGRIPGSGGTEKYQTREEKKEVCLANQISSVKYFTVVADRPGEAVRVLYQVAALEID